MTPDAGDIMLADLGEEERRQVLVLSSAKFHRLADRAIVAPVAAARPFPWRITFGDDVFAVDLMTTISTDLLLEHAGRVPQEVTQRAQRAMRFML